MNEDFPGNTLVTRVFSAEKIVGLQPSLPDPTPVGGSINGDSLSPAEDTEYRDIQLFSSSSKKGQKDEAVGDTGLHAGLTQLTRISFTGEPHFLTEDHC